jgi:tRNA(Leu) C34 or U34 (ribose-2'-O)-methylase TrmL
LTVVELAEASGISARKGKDRERNERLSGKLSGVFSANSGLYIVMEVVKDIDLSGELTVMEVGKEGLLGELGVAVESEFTIRDRELSYARGYYGIGIYQGKTVANLGTLWRSADVFSAHFIFTIGRKYKRQSSDTTKAYRKIPLYNYVDFETFYSNMPYDCPLVGVEISGRSESILSFTHPKRCIYLLGAEDNGLPPSILSRCHHLIQLPGRSCLNVAVAGSLVMYDRYLKSPH